MYVIDCPYSMDLFTPNVQIKTSKNGGIVIEATQNAKFAQLMRWREYPLIFYSRVSETNLTYSDDIEEEWWIQQIQFGYDNVISIMNLKNKLYGPFRPQKYADKEMHTNEPIMRDHCTDDKAYAHRRLNYPKQCYLSEWVMIPP